MNNLGFFLMMMPRIPVMEYVIMQIQIEPGDINFSPMLVRGDLIFLLTYNMYNESFSFQSRISTIIRNCSLILFRATIQQQQGMHFRTNISIQYFHLYYCNCLQN